MNTHELAKRVSSRRKAKQLSQQELADLSDLSRNYISMIERGEAQNVSTKVIEKLAIALEVTPAELLGANRQQTMLIPPGLREFALSEGLPYEDVDRLAHIPRRGQEPKTKEDWQKLYDLIKDYL